MNKPPFRSIAATGLFLATMAFLPGPGPAADPQAAGAAGPGLDCAANATPINDQDPGVTFQGPVRAPLSAEQASEAVDEVSQIIERSPYAPPSRRLGTRLPKSVDLRGELPPVGAEGDVRANTCVTFATVYYQMTQSVKHFLHPAWDLKNPEHQFSVHFVNTQGGLGYPELVYQVLQEMGAVDTAEMQYDPRGWGNDGPKPTDRQFEAAKPYRIGGYAALWENGRGSPSEPYDNPIQNAKSWLADGFVLSCLIDANKSTGFPSSPGSCNPPKVFFDPEIEHISPGHGVALVGYNDNINPSAADPEHRGGFLMVNSEGPNWNGKMHGYLWLSYAYVRRYAESCWIMMPPGGDTPVVTGYSRGKHGTDPTVIITGTNFGSQRRLAGVEFNGIAAEYIWSFTDESIEVTPAKCVTAGPLVVYNWEGRRSKPIRYTPLPKTAGK